jgi:hypothetical protein
VARRGDAGEESPAAAAAAAAVAVAEVSEVSDVRALRLLAETSFFCCALSVRNDCRHRRRSVFVYGVGAVLGVEEFKATRRRSYFLRGAR